MTLATLLEELKEVDAETSEDIGDIANVIRIQADGSFSVDSDDSDFIIQGSTQRACERREWHWTIMKDPYQDGYRAEIAVVSESHLSDHICIDDLAIKCATSPAEALLAAYIAAVRGEAK
jgi:hypothetical protein